MVVGAAAQPPSSAPGCRSEFELNQSPVQGSVPASFKGPRSKTQERSGGNYDSIERMFASQEVSSRWVHFTSIALAAGFIPAATLSLMSPALLRVTTKKIRTAYRKESRPVAQRPADERKPSGFPLIQKRKGRGSTEPRRVTDLRND